jgi:hypothetical protein
MYLVVKDIDLNSKQSSFPITRYKTLLHIYKFFIKYVIAKFGENIKNSYYRTAGLKNYKERMYVHVTEYLHVMTSFTT